MMIYSGKLHAISKCIMFFSGAAFSIVTQLSSAHGEPIDSDFQTETTIKKISVGSDGIAEADSNSLGSLVDRPDLQSVNPARFGSADNLDFVETNLPTEQTRHYSASEISKLILTESVKIGLDPDLAHLVANIESQFNQFAVSETGAVGIMQLMPDTARELGVVNSYDAAQNIRGGVSYLKRLLDEFGNPLMAVAAYHSGPEAAHDANGIPDGPRTAQYMVRILNDYYKIGQSTFSPPGASAVATSNDVTASIEPINAPAKHKARAAAKRTQKPNIASAASADGDGIWEGGFVMNLD